MATRAKTSSQLSTFERPPRQAGANGKAHDEGPPVLAILVHLSPGPGAMTPKKKRGEANREQ